MEFWNELLLYAGTIGWVPAICLFAGVVLVIIEMFTPGFAAPGITGIILIITGVVLTADTLLEGLIWMLAIMAILTVALVIALRSATKGALSRTPLVNQSMASRDEGYLSVEDMAFFVGKTGKALTSLRPAGTADFDGVRLDVVTEGNYIEKGTTVRILKVEGRRIVVAPIDQ